MNRPTKRFLALAGSALVGAFGAVALASPAQAHHPIISGKAVCQADGQYKIDWTVSNGNWPNPRAKLLEVQPTPNTSVTNITVGVWLNPNQSVTGTQFVPGTTTTATLRVKAQWYKTNGDPSNVIEQRTGEVKMPGTCKPEPIPTATFTNACDGTVNVHLVNPTDSAIDFTVKGGDGWSKSANVPAKGQADVVVPAENAKVAIVVSAGKDAIAKSPPWARPSECPKPSPLGEGTCENFTIKLTNPQGGQATEATVTYGTQVKKVTVAPGATETVELSPSSETSATVKFADWDDTYTVKYEKPANCAGLPQTGASTGTYVASGTGLAALGVLVFFLARRRQVRLRRMAAM